MQVATMHVHPVALQILAIIYTFLVSVILLNLIVAVRACAPGLARGPLIATVLGGCATVTDN